MLILTAILQARPGKEIQLEQILRELVEAVCREEGCLEYRLHKSKQKKGRFLFYEKYVDEEALQLHRSTDYMMAAKKRISVLSDGETRLEFFDSLASKHK